MILVTISYVSLSVLSAWQPPGNLFSNSRKAAQLNRSISIHVSGELNQKSVVWSADVSGCDLGDFISRTSNISGFWHQTAASDHFGLWWVGASRSKATFLMLLLCQSIFGEMLNINEYFGAKIQNYYSLVIFCFPAHTHTTTRCRESIALASFMLPDQWLVGHQLISHIESHPCRRTERPF